MNMSESNRFDWVGHVLVDKIVLGWLLGGGWIKVVASDSPYWDEVAMADVGDFFDTLLPSYIEMNCCFVVEPFLVGKIVEGIPFGFKTDDSFETRPIFCVGRAQGIGPI